MDSQYTVTDYNPDAPAPAATPEPAPPVDTATPAPETVADPGAPVVAVVPAPAATETPAPATAPVTPPAPASLPAPAVAAAPVKSVFEELGVDEPFARKLLAAAKNPEEFKTFAKKFSTDVDAMDDTELLRLDTKTKYPTLTPVALERMVQRRLKDEFLQDGLESEDEAVGKELLKASMQSVKDGLIAERDSWTPTVVEAPAAAATEPAAPVVYPTDAYFDTFDTNRVLKLGTGEDAYNHTPAADFNLREVATDPVTLLQKLFNADGTMNGQAVATVHAVLSDPALFGNLIEHGKALGAKAQFDGLVNATIPTAGANPAPSGQYIVKDYTG